MTMNLYLGLLMIAIGTMVGLVSYFRMLSVLKSWQVRYADPMSSWGMGFETNLGLFLKESRMRRSWHWGILFGMTLGLILCVGGVIVL